MDACVCVCVYGEVMESSGKQWRLSGPISVCVRVCAGKVSIGTGMSRCCWDRAMPGGEGLLFDTNRHW